MDYLRFPATPRVTGYSAAPTLIAYYNGQLLGTRIQAQRAEGRILELEATNLQQVPLSFLRSGTRPCSSERRVGYTPAVRLDNVINPLLATLISFDILSVRGCDLSCNVFPTGHTRSFKPSPRT